ncbi:hypothetical protein THF1C08_240085 [Vibrio jasicida]|uniref:Uncharacterized protein n=1 Tax=Vibrio jasicida TaxID=766224 RepID=A0AAU9QN58_9VIBR|nr:hypothetical protein THF1C08_240085 [Vibrio jasicida]CAH1591819.1 hypothetical protein THF1A12_240085 [Vibrio jasicida]CAH1608688.1 hypothetical protein THF5G08_70017 [Vibrio jasicida]
MGNGLPQDNTIIRMAGIENKIHNLVARPLTTGNYSFICTL